MDEDSTTGTEVGTPLDEHAARRLTERIRLLATSVREQVDKLSALVDQARREEAWRVLGFPSWTAYLSDVLGGALPGLDREDRREVVALLAGQGMSVRAIAPVVDTSPATVARDLAGQVSRDETPAAVGLDGKTYPRLVVVPDRKGAGRSRGRPTAAVLARRVRDRERRDARAAEGTRDYERESADALVGRIASALALLEPLSLPQSRAQLRDAYAPYAAAVRAPFDLIRPEPLRKIAAALLAYADEEDGHARPDA